ncbi:hypothetical protein CTB91_04167 [Dickeya solani]|nr:hypothetical protein CTB91_04167 [Dickeya solani]AYQ54053.1 hypothetical protein DSOL99_04165 [Dickeya solani]NUA42034.1 hypothetical protein [Dickeya solani]NUA44161.1 hypothetical protein [Dickeya solani]NUA48181.1 hypothetical protein [Dickeya solani]
MALTIEPDIAHCLKQTLKRPLLFSYRNTFL